MMSRRRGLVALLALVAIATGVMVAGGVGMARSTKPKIVNVGDSYFAPTVVKIHKRGKVSWRWPSGGTFETHNVTLVDGPRGVKKSRFRSQNMSSGRFTKRFKKPGKYEFVCTLHRSEMQMDVKVRRPA
jgi:plastocyanin